jgi:hypothetical protein
VKPEIFTVAEGGFHNLDLEKARSKVLAGGSWKRQRIIVLLPADKMMSTKVALTHWNLIFPPNNGVFRMLCLGLEVGDAYSKAIETVVKHPDLSQWEYILTVEADNMPPPDGVLMLCESMEAHPELHVVSGLYWTKGHGGCAQIWGDPKDPVLNFRPQPPEIDKLQECCGTGMGFALWRVSMFLDKKLRTPWFKTTAGREGCGTQDLYFWNDARKHGYRCAVDTRVRVGHYDVTNDMVW